MQTLTVCKRLLNVYEITIAAQLKVVSHYPSLYVGILNVLFTSFVHLGIYATRLSLALMDCVVSHG